MSAAEERVVENTLRELLAGDRPPDLSATILAAVAARQAGHVPVDAQVAREVQAAVEASTTEYRQAHRAAARRSASNARHAWLLVAGLASLLVGYFAFAWNSTTPVQVADANGEPNPINPARRKNASGEWLDLSPAHGPTGNRGPRTIHPAGETEQLPLRPAPSRMQASAATTEGTGLELNRDTLAQPNPLDEFANPYALLPQPRSQRIPVPQVSLTASNDAEVIAFINDSIRRRWVDAGITPSPPASDAEWCRRVYLDLLGRIPTVAELDAYTTARNSDKRAKLVNLLLEDETYAEELARNWATQWTNQLIGRSGGKDPGRPVNRAGLHKWLRDAVSQNMPYDQFVLALLADQGENLPGQPNYRGAVNFLLDNLQDKHIPATTKTAQIFLGMRIGCTQCHDHPFNDWKQQRFWGLNSFFKQAVAVQGTPGVAGSFLLADADFNGEGGNVEEAEVYYETKNGLLKVAYPVFPDGTSIPPSGRIDTVQRRAELAKLITQSNYFRLAQVNRLWGYFLGYGFTTPVDDLGPHNPPSHPELLQPLADLFQQIGYDQRKLIRWIVLSEPYSLSSRIVTRDLKDHPEIGETPLFSRFYMRQMRPEELYESLVTATQVHRIVGDIDQRERQRHEWLQQFVITFATDENDETTTFNGTITQALLLMNGELMAHATGVEPGGFLHEVANAPTSDRQKAEQLYLAALGRKPSPPEANMAQQLWIARMGDTTAALQDIWWALLNSNEFIMNH